MKHEKFCKENAVEDRKVKGGSEVRRQVQEEYCEKAKLSVSGLAISVAESFEEEFVKVVETCQKVGSKVERTARKVRANGSELSKPDKSEEKVQGKEEEGSVLEDSQARKQKQEEHCEEFKSGLATFGALKEDALMMV